MTWIRTGLLLLLSASVPLTLRADRVELRAGETFDGTVGAQDAERITLTLADGSTRVFRRREVRTVTLDAALRAQLAARLRAVDAGPDAGPRARRAEATLDVARWAGEWPALIEDAERLLDRALTLDPELEDLVDYQRVRIAATHRRWEAARERGRKALTRNPNHEPILALLRRMQADWVADSMTRVGPLLEAYRKRRYKHVVALSRRVLGGLGEHSASALSAHLKKDLGLSLAGVLIDARFNLRCSARGCRGGMIKCAFCEGTGRNHRFRREVVGTRGQRSNVPRYTVWCTHCKGLIYRPCGRCVGTGFDLGTPTELERKELVETLVKRAADNGKVFERLILEARKQDGDIKVRAVDSYAILTLARQLLFYLDHSIELAPQLGAPGGLNLQSRVREVTELMNGFLSGLSSSYMEGADRLYRESMDAPGPGSTQIGNLPSRVLQLQEALSLAEESRRHILALLESDPASKGFLKGNYQRRLELSEQFIERVRRAMNALRNLERRGLKQAGVTQR